MECPNCPKSMTVVSRDTSHNPNDGTTYARVKHTCDCDAWITIETPETNQHTDANDNPVPADEIPEMLRELQAYIWRMNKERGFNTDDPSKKMVMLIEEVGELAKAVRKISGLKFTDTTKQTELSEELADVQIVLLGLASIVDVDMLEAIRAKEAKNKNRKWK